MVDKLKKGPIQDSEGEDEFDDAWKKAMTQWSIDPEKVESRLQEQKDEDSDENQVTMRVEQATSAAKEVLNIPAIGPLPDVGEQDDDTPVIETKPLEVQREELKVEILNILIEEAAQNIQNFEFASIIINAPSKLIGTTIKQQLDKICKNEDLVLKAGEDNQKIEITKKEGVEFEDRKMDKTSYFGFYSLLTSFPNLVTIT